LFALLACPAYAEIYHACAVLSPQKGHDDTAAIQAALNLCNPAKAVVLTGGIFHSGPLILPRGVTLYLDRGATLVASQNPRDYDLKPGACGESPEGNVPNCKPFLFAYQAAYSGVAGSGVIDGQGESWKMEAGSTPDLVSSYESQGFKITGVTLRNAAGVHAAIYKTIGFSLADVRIESSDSATSGPGLLLSNAVDATVTGAWIRVPSHPISLKASILGPTTGVKFSDIHISGGRGIAIGDDVFGMVRGVTFDDVSINDTRSAFFYNLEGTQGGSPRELHFGHICLHNVHAATQPESLPAQLKPDQTDTSCPNSVYSPNVSFTVDRSTVSKPGKARLLVVQSGESIQKAVDALPDTGGEITVKPGTYREVVTIRKPHVHLHGEAPDPAKTTIVYNNTSSKSGGTFNTSTVFVEADDVTIDRLSLVNDAGAGKGQAVALHVVGDRAVFRNLRISGAQDTLFAASRYCYGDYGPCVAARQYFADCFIEGNTDFIFGDGKAVFERCELHGVPTGSVMYTAQSKHTPDQDSGYIFQDCRLTGEPRNSAISLGRSWRPYATVVFLNARIEAPVIPAGWTEWLRFGVPTLPTAYYAEYKSTGPGANPEAREKYSHQLSDKEAEKWSPREFLKGEDNWNPMAAK
jgi:pectin methylesterase-like acyl-CoA thioesterase